MEDQSYLDKKYFIDNYVYNCPFCNRRHVSYKLETVNSFDWTNVKKCYIYIVQCLSCNKRSMHLSYLSIHDLDAFHRLLFMDDSDLDSKIFYSVPTSYFVLDNRIPELLRELITEGEESLKMNLLTGASACIRKCIYELLIIENSLGQNYDEKIKSLKGKYPDTDPDLFAILEHIKDLTSDKVHEQSWDKWNSKNLKLITEALKAVLYDIYVIPAIRKSRVADVLNLKKNITSNHKSTKNTDNLES